jgi:protease-4
MALTSDTLLERLHLKRQITFWRLCTLALVAMVALYSVENANTISPVSGDYIARYTVDGMIVDDIKRDKLLKDIEKHDHIKALIVRIDSPGGTAVGGEALFARLKAISAKKPVVSVCRTMCTSAGYMTAIAAPYVVAQESSITGSIGVILQSFEASELATKIGITPITIKSGINKAVPSPAEKLLPEQQAVLQEAINDFFGIFKDMVSKERKLSVEQITSVSDGRIFTGRQALARKLIDKIGGEEEALEWLKNEKKVDITLHVRDMEIPREDETLLQKLSSWSGLNFLSQYTRNKLDGLLLIWQPSAL